MDAHDNRIKELEKQRSREAARVGIALMLIVMILLVGTFLLAKAASSELRKVGLKSIIENVWEGKDEN